MRLLPWLANPGNPAMISPAGVSTNFDTSGQFSITGRYYFGKPSFLGVPGGMPHGKFLNSRLSQISQTHFPAFWGLLLFCFVVLRSPPIWTKLEQKKKLNIYSKRFPNVALFIDAKRSIISKFQHRKLALSMFSTKVGKNRYRSISFVLTLGQNMLP